MHALADAGGRPISATLLFVTVALLAWSVWNVLRPRSGPEGKILAPNRPDADAQPAPGRT